MAALTKAQILQADDLGCERVDIPEWGGHAYVRILTGAERDAWEESLFDKNDKVSIRNIRAKFATAVVCDGEAKPLFTDADADQLGLKSSAALDRIFDAGRKLNRLSDKDVEDLAKNSGGGQDESSPSA